MFRSQDNIAKTDYLRFNLSTPIIQPNNTQYQEKTGYIFNMTDRSSWFDWYNGYFLVKYKLQKKADGANIIANVPATPVMTGTINDSASMINHLMITSAGKKIYDGNDLHKICFIKGLLEYSQDYSKTVAKQSNWFLDDRISPMPAEDANITNNAETGEFLRSEVYALSKDAYAIIPLNRFSFFEELRDRMLPPMQIELNITLNDDREFIYRVGAHETRYVILDFQLWLPRLNFTSSGQKLVNSSFLIPSKWQYLREFIKHSSPTNSVSGIYQITPSIKNAKHVFVYLQRNKTNNELANPYIFDTFNINSANNNCTLSTCRLQYGNSTFYPELEYDCEFKPRLYNDLLEYSYRKNDYNTGVQLNINNFSELYPLIYFDLRNYKESITDDPKQILFHYRLNQQAGNNYMIYAIVMYEENVIINKIGNELIIV